MLVWDTDPSLRDNELRAAFVDVWCAIPEVVFSRALGATDKDVAIGGAALAAGAIGLGLVDELRMFRHPVLLGGGTPFLPPVTERVRLDLIETRPFGSRAIYERYRRAPWRVRLTPPSGSSALQLAVVAQPPAPARIASMTFEAKRFDLGPKESAAFRDRLAASDGPQG